MGLGGWTYGPTFADQRHSVVFRSLLGSWISFVVEAKRVVEYSDAYGTIRKRV